MSERTISFRGSLALLIARVPIGLFFVIAGIGKFRMGIDAFAKSADDGIPSYLPHALGNAFLHVLPFAEVLVGLFLIVGFFGRSAAAVASLLLLSFIMAQTGIMASPKPFHENVIFLSIALALALTGPGDLSIDAFRRRRPA